MRLKTIISLVFCTGLGLVGVPHAAQAHGDKFNFGTPAEVTQATRIIKITMLDLAFQPNLIQVKQGEIVRFVVTNTSQVDHDFTLGDAVTQSAHRKEMAEMAAMGDMAEMHDHMSHDPNAIFVKAGATKEITWKFPRAMTIEFACNVPGHYEAGMKGVIKISALGATQ